MYVFVLFGLGILIVVFLFDIIFDWVFIFMVDIFLMGYFGVKNVFS